jgi:predicted transcriptional regulator
LPNLNEYLAILGTIAHHNPSYLAQLTDLFRMDHDKLLDALNFLLSQGCLVQETTEARTTSKFTITERGLRILEFFNKRTLT